MRKSVVGLVDGVDSSTLETALTNWGLCLEAVKGLPLHGDHLAPTQESQGLYMALTTASAYRVEPARSFIKVLASSLGLPADCRESMELALHEALVNAIIHGNLELTSAGRQSMESFADYCRAIERHLADPVLAGRCVEVFATWDQDAVALSVQDNGKGYDPASQPSLGEDPYRKSGRGLVLIASVADEVIVSDGGRRLTMRFVR